MLSEKCCILSPGPVMAYSSAASPVNATKKFARKKKRKEKIKYVRQYDVGVERGVGVHGMLKEDDLYQDESLKSVI